MTTFSNYVAENGNQLAQMTNEEIYVSLLNYVKELASQKGKNTAKRKDRFSSMAYANYLAELIEKEEYRNKRNNKSPDFFMLFN